MLAHKVDAEQPARYSNLLSAAQKLERQTEARDPLPPKTAVTSGPHVTHSQTTGNLFPSHKLKGNHTFTAQAATLGNGKVGKDSGAKAEGGEETELSDGKEVEATSRAGETDQSIEYIIHFTKVLNYI